MSVPYALPLFRSCFLRFSCIRFTRYVCDGPASCKEPTDRSVQRPADVRNQRFSWCPISGEHRIRTDLKMGTISKRESRLWSNVQHHFARARPTQLSGHRRHGFLRARHAV